MQPQHSPSSSRTCTRRTNLTIGHATVHARHPNHASTSSRADSLLSHLLRRTLPTERRSLYSWHSFRIRLAYALLAQGAQPELIQALCRWRSRASLDIYARLNAEDYGAWILKAQGANISSISSANLPQVDDAVRASILSGLAEWEGLDN